MDPIFSAQFQMPAGVGGGDYGSAPTGMFGSKANLRDALMAAVAGFMARRSPQVSNGIFDALQRKQLLAQQEAQYQRRRNDEFTDFTKKRDYEIAHPEATGPHYFEDNTGNLMAVGPDGKPFEVYHDPNPWKLVPNGMGGVVPVNMAELMRGQSGLPAVGSVIDDPRKKGGPTPQASGGFPGY